MPQKVYTDLAEALALLPDKTLAIVVEHLATAHPQLTDRQARRAGKLFDALAAVIDVKEYPIPL